MAITGTDARRIRPRGPRTPLAATLPAVLAIGAAAQTFELRDYSGGELFDRFCAACHGPEGRGDGPVASTLNVLVPDLTRLAERNGGTFPAGDVRDVIDGRAVVVAHGPRTMPVWGYEFWVEEGADIEAEAAARELIDRLVRHVESIQRGTEPGRPLP
ncbi:MAG TPA: c-type cytochrome [Gammaproteobacteria bacterium]